MPMSRGIELHLMAAICCRKRLCRGRALFGRRGLPVDERIASQIDWTALDRLAKSLFSAAHPETPMNARAVGILRGENRVTSCCVLPVRASCARTSPMTGANLNPRPEHPPAMMICS